MSSSRMFLTEPSDSTERPHEPMNGSTIKCNICAKLGHVLDCCKGLSGCCATCADLDHLLIQDRQETRIWKAHCEALREEIAILKNASEKRRQEKEDRIKSLQQQILEADEEEKRLDIMLDERKATLRRLQAEERARQPMQTYTIKEAKKGGKGKKKHP